MLFRTRLLCWCAWIALHSTGAAAVELTPPEFSDAVQPQVAVSPDGRVHIAFGRGNSIYYTGSPDGRVFTPPSKVGEIDKLALRMRRGPRISATRDALVISAISHADGDVHAWISGNQGATWREIPRLNGTAHSAREGLHAMAGDGRGLLITAWLDLRSGGTELWSRVSHNAGLTWAPEFRIYASPEGRICQCCQPALAIGPGGEIAALWRNSLDGSRDPWMSMSRDGGAHFETAQKIGVGTWKLNACPMDGGAITIDPAGQPVSVWRRERSVFLSTTPRAEEKLADHAAQPVAAFAGSRLVVVWEEGGALMIRDGENVPALLAHDARAPSIAALPAGGIITAWESTANGHASLRCEIVTP